MFFLRAFLAKCFEKPGSGSGSKKIFRTEEVYENQEEDTIHICIHNQNSLVPLSHIYL